MQDELKKVIDLANDANPAQTVIFAPHNLPWLFVHHGKGQNYLATSKCGLTLEFYPSGHAASNAEHVSLASPAPATLASSLCASCLAREVPRWGPGSEGGRGAAPGNLLGLGRERLRHGLTRILRGAGPKHEDVFRCVTEHVRSDMRLMTIV